VGGSARGRLAGGPAALHRLSWLGVGFAALDMFGDQHLAVEDPHQMIS
jgi:hypothetical protein